MDELDEEKGAFPSWSEGSDWRTHALIADYLLQSVAGTRSALEAAALAAIDHRQANYSQNSVARIAWNQRRSLGQDAYFWKVAGSPSARHKTQKIEVALEHCFFHMGQALDRLAAAVLIVGGFGVNVGGTVYHSTLESMHRSTLADKRRTPTVAPDKSIAPHGSRARELQAALLDPLSHLDDFGPPGWFDWLRGTRNALTHRPPSTHITIAGRDGTFVRPLYRQPDLSDIQSIIYASRRAPTLFTKRRPGSAMQAALIDRRSEDILDGLIGSVCPYIAACTEAMSECWNARNADPKAIIQHGSQWPIINPDPSATDFTGEGYGEAIQLDQADSMVAHPAMAKRFTAARTTGDQVHRWFN